MEFIVGRIVIVAPEKCQRANQKTKTDRLQRWRGFVSIAHRPDVVEGVAYHCEY